MTSLEQHLFKVYKYAHLQAIQPKDSDFRKALTVAVVNNENLALALVKPEVFEEYLALIIKSKTAWRPHLPWLQIFADSVYKTAEEGELHAIKGKFEELPIRPLKAPYQANIALTYPRAFQAWTKKEVSLFEELLALTNDIELISQISGRTIGAILPMCQKICYQEKLGPVFYANRDEKKPKQKEAKRSGAFLALLNAGLNEEQAEAVSADDKRILVLAGAGSGKTRTLIEKVNFLIDEKGVNAREIMALTFTKNAANEMVDRLIEKSDYGQEYKVFLDKVKKSKDRERIRREYKSKIGWIRNLEISTFHSVSYKLLRTHGGLHYDNKFEIIGSGFDDEMNKFGSPETPEIILQKVLIDKCNVSSDFLIAFKRYVLDFFPSREKKDPKSKTKLEQGKSFVSLNGTHVRSKSEQYIADWFYRHKLDFVYEPEVYFNEFSFTPDFYIPEANLYLEHQSKISFDMKGKLSEFRAAGKTLVRTYEFQTRDTREFNQALDEVVRKHLPANKTELGSFRFDEEFAGYQPQIKQFLRDVLAVIDIIKVYDLKVDEACKKGSASDHERIKRFYQLARPLIHGYADYNRSKSYLDFNDLILESVKVLENDEKVSDKLKNQYKYILVDEFQDVNDLQVRFLKLLLTDRTQLFCVGDDWQSIYGFRGSNVQYTVDFESYFSGSRLILLTQNYRSASHIVEAGNEIIKNNKKRVDKKIKAAKTSGTKIHLAKGDSEEKNVAYVVDAVAQLYNRGFEKEDIMILYRRSAMFEPYQEALVERKLYVTNRTIHASKGLEARAVFILGLTSGSYGFPDTREADSLFQVIRKSDISELLEEERRLFYVAITRAKEELFLITELGIESQFISEIPSKYLSKATRNAILNKDSVTQCVNCSNLIDSTFTFCPKCGHAIQKNVL